MKESPDHKYLVRWIEVVVYLDREYKKNKSIWVPETMTKKQITKKVNKVFGDKGWAYYDILGSINQIKSEDYEH